MQLKSVKKKLLRLLGNLFLVPVINVLCKTLKIHEINKDAIKKLETNKVNAVFAFWHGTMLVPWFLLRRYKPSTIISKSSDGDILTRILNNWDYKVKRGSSSKGGKAVLEDLIKEAEANQVIAITPDGPKGPEKVMKAGVVVLAKKTETPIVLIGVNYSKKIMLKSWDKFEIPFFFSKVVIIYSESIYIDNQMSFNETDEKIKFMGDRLNQIQLEAESNC
jgi:lysophospholipid acyltransferase (LPLAT)-like uncharacterized protein